MIRAILITSIMTSSSFFISGGAISDDNEERTGESAYRHNLMEVVGKAARNIAGIVRGRIDHKDTIAANARIVAAAVEAVKPSFAIDTRAVAGKSQSLDLIWENWEDFSSRLDKLRLDATTLAELAEDGGDIGPAVGTFFGNCRACHDLYKAESED